MTISTDEGETRIGGGGEIPDWVPAHPATTARQSLLRSTGPTGDNGQASFTVDAAADEVAAFYKAELEEARERDPLGGSRLGDRLLRLRRGLRR